MSSGIPLTAQEATAFTARLREGRLPCGAGDLIDLITELETLKNVACGIQADASSAYDAARRSDQAAAGVPAARQGRGVAAEVAAD
ncbi:hypothetical protein [Nocardioides sambongensis]|uniref:hypothetical protein n=1 Tax=Nocardioides sambongensis TaxID=2589074 RepID=UPI00112A0555|nr:hypothetical protein [Nocardioides sambongensis]